MKRKAALLPILAMALVLAVLAAGCSFGGNEKSEQRAQNVAQKAPEVSEDVPEDEPVARVAAQVSPSVVQVNVQAVQETPIGPQEGQGVGSGVIYRSDGYIITNNHVVAPPGSSPSEEVNIAFADGSTEQGEVVGRDPSTEIAVVRVNRDDLPAARFKEGSDLLVGQLAVAIGSPSGFQSTVTSGIISGLNREVPAEYTGGRQEAALVDLIQTDAPISPGNSGGALVDRDGEVVGVNVAYLPPETRAESIGFAIPSDTVISVADQLIENGRVSSPFLGIRNADLTPEIAEQFGLSDQTGVIVVEVEPGGPAADAGLQREDVITALDSTGIENSGDLLGALRDYRPGDTVTLTILRGGSGAEETVEVDLGERPQQ
ncbi:MAG: trypsin-like peptidase domain-containing protein [Actinomycetota bacterium]|nr:trypsin-like peptidase domain-containing protein [Actinomycetota bacterium]